MHEARRPGWKTTLSSVIVVLTLVAAVGGILFPDTYQEADSGKNFSRAYWFANDLVTLIVAVPLLVVARWLADRGSRRAELVWLGGIYYTVYNYLFYLFGALLNWFFPVHVALVTVAVSVLVLTLSRSDPRGVATSVSVGRRRAMWVGGYLALLGVANVVIWSVEWANCLSADESDTVHGSFVRTVAGVDIPMLATAMAVGAFGLWRRRPWGPAVATVVNIGIAVYMFALAATALSNAQAGVDGAGAEMPQWIVLGIGSLAASLALLSTGTGRSEEVAPVLQRH